MFKSEDEKRAERAAAANRACNKCGGTGTLGIGGRGASTSTVCDRCKGSGQTNH